MHVWTTYLTMDGIKNQTGPAIILFVGFFIYFAYLIFQNQINWIWDKFSAINLIGNLKKPGLFDKKMDPYF